MGTPYEATFEEPGSGGVRVKVSISADAVAAEHERLVQRELNSPTVLKGFRPGKAPPQVKAAQARTRAKQALPEELVRGSLQQLLIDRDLFLISEPNILVPDVQLGRPFEYVAELELLPLPNVAGYDQIEVQAAAASSEQDREEALFEALFARNSIEPPARLVAMRTAELTAQAPAGEMNAEELRQRAQYEISKTLLLDAVAVQEKITVTAEEIRKAKVRLATDLGLGFAEVEEYAARAEHAADLVREVKRDKAKQLLLSRLKLS